LVYVRVISDFIADKGKNFLRSLVQVRVFSGKFLAKLICLIHMFPKALKYNNGTESRFDYLEEAVLTYTPGPAHVPLIEDLSFLFIEVLGWLGKDRGR
jgi:hypothetical protein